MAPNWSFVFGSSSKHSQNDPECRNPVPSSSANWCPKDPRNPTPFCPRRVSFHHLLLHHLHRIARGQAFSVACSCSSNHLRFDFPKFAMGSLSFKPILPNRHRGQGSCVLTASPFGGYSRVSGATQFTRVRS